MKMPKYLKSQIPKVLKWDMNRFNLDSSNGFTLIEILVAITILAIGILTVSQMTILGMRTSTVINQRMYAREVLNRYFEAIQNLPTSDPLLDWVQSANLDDTVNYDHRVIENTPGGIYTVIWNILDNHPDNRFKTVRIHIFWAQNPRGIHSSDILKLY